MNELSEFHHAENGSDKTKKIVGLVAVVLIVAGAACYIVELGMLQPTPAPAGKAYPRGL